MSEVKSKPLDALLAGIKCDSERMRKIDIMLRGVNGLGDMCDRLSRRMDAFEESAKLLAERNPAPPAEPLAYTS